MLEPCNTLAGNLFAHGVHKSKWFGKCVFKLKKCFVVRKLLHRKVWKVLFFRPKRQCGRCCTTAVQSILRFHPYKLDRIAQASCLLCARRENMLCFCLYWNRTKRKWRNCMFFGRPKTAMWAMLRCSHFVNISIPPMKIIMKDGPQQCWRAPRIIFAFHWDSKKGKLRDMCKKGLGLWVGPGLG